MSADLEILSMMLKVGAKLDSDQNHTGQPLMSLDLDRLKTDSFS
jgi:hypothetical protein